MTFPKLDYDYYRDYVMEDVHIVEDRYTGVYSGGKWNAVRGWEANRQAVEDGPDSGDPCAMDFWENPPKWIASGKTPTEAYDALCEKNRPEIEEYVEKRTKELEELGNAQDDLQTPV